MPSEGEFINTHVMRSRLMLEVASHLVARPAWSYRQVQIHLREQGGESWKFCLFASDAPASVHAVARGEADIAIVNPGGVLAMANHGAGPFTKAIPDLRTIMVFPQFDQLGFGVTPRTGLRSLTDLRDRRYPLRVSLRGQRDHSVSRGPQGPDPVVWKGADAPGSDVSRHARGAPPGAASPGGGAVLERTRLHLLVP